MTPTAVVGVDGGTDLFVDADGPAWRALLPPDPLHPTSSVRLAVAVKNENAATNRAGPFGERHDVRMFAQPRSSPVWATVIAARSAEIVRACRPTLAAISG